MLDIEFFRPEEVLKATVHKGSGKLGFSMSAINRMDFENNRYFKVGHNSRDENDDSLYLVPSHENDDDAFKVGKAGDYYYIRIKNVLNDLDIDYETETVSYEIRELKSDNMKYYRLDRRK